MPKTTIDTSTAKRQTGGILTRTETKADKVIKLLRRKNGATIAELQKATGWQAHSIRGIAVRHGSQANGHQRRRSDR